MNFRTQIPDNSNSIHIQSQLNYDSKIVSIGSCFTKNIGLKLNYFKFRNTFNPFGILFHPKAIETLITNSINKKEYSEEDVFFLNERWHSFDAHSDLSHESKNELLTNLNTSIANLSQQLNESTHLIITLGTSWVYRHIESDKIVANCHKVPQKKFLKELHTADEVSACLENICALVKSVNPIVKIIFTVSPVRHLKDGFTENALSKAHLISAVHQVVEPRKSIHYFPSYEILLDDLRDYRFYESDMLHPNKTAINYIWESFKNSWIDEKSFDLMTEIDGIQKSLAHKPFNSKSEEYHQFSKKLQVKIERLKAQHNISF